MRSIPVEIPLAIAEFIKLVEMMDKATEEEKVAVIGSIFKGEKEQIKEVVDNLDILKPLFKKITKLLK